MRTKQELINYCIKEFDYKSYLEIGVRRPRDNFDQIKCNRKTGVDPRHLDEDPPPTYLGTSDDFFSQNKIFFDIILIDGYHEANQVFKDIDNSINFLNKDGVIILHDCNPPLDWETGVPLSYIKKSGTVWRAFTHYRRHEHLDMITIDIDTGLGIIKKRPNKSPLVVDLAVPPFDKLKYEDLNANRKIYLNLMSAEEGLSWL